MKKRSRGMVVVMLVSFLLISTGLEAGTKVKVGGKHPTYFGESRDIAVKPGDLCYGMSSMDYLKKFKEEELGNFIIASFGFADYEKSFSEDSVERILKEINWCRENKIYMEFYGLCRPHLREYYCTSKGAKGAWGEVVKAAGSYLVGRHVAGEIGHSVYCLKTHTTSLPPAKDMESAKEAYMARVKKRISPHRKSSGNTPLIIIDPSLLSSYSLEAGIDRVCLEVMCTDPNLMFSVLRGASRAYQRENFGAHIAMTCYGGVKMDELWFSRWKTSLYFSYISGADPIYAERGHWRISCLSCNDYSFEDKECERFRKILREFYHFCQSHPRPEKGPKVKIAVIQGNLDGDAGFWNTQVWGQNGKHWQHSSPEYGWDYFDCFFSKEKWFNNTHTGGIDFSGNPPYGQIDIVPANTSLKILNNYSCLIFLGWNTMTEEIYERLKNYVKRGGHLFMAIPHLSTGIRREEDLILYNNGDYRDLFGVKVEGKGKVLDAGMKIVSDSSLPSYSFPNWTLNSDPIFLNGPIKSAQVKVSTARIIARMSFTFNEKVKEMGPPILIENALGKGKAFLLTSWDYPGARELELFMKDIIRVISTGEQAEDIKLESNDGVRYAVYEENGLKTIYLLNTNSGLSQQVNLYLGDKTFPLQIPANELRIVWVNDELAVSPQDKSVYVKEISGNTVELEGEGRRKIDILFLNGKHKKINFKVDNRVIMYQVKDNYLVDLG